MKRFARELLLLRIERLTRVLSFSSDHNAINMGIAGESRLSAGGFVLRQKSIPGAMKALYFVRVSDHYASLSQRFNDVRIGSRSAMQRHRECCEARYFRSNGVIGSVVSNASQRTSIAVSCRMALDISSM